MNSLGQNVSQEDIDEMIKEADSNCKQFLYYKLLNY
jgi:Ca2+-binding EF-hand superfamily protein